MSDDHKNRIKIYLKLCYPNTDLSQLFFNLDKESTPAIFQDPKTNRKIIENYTSN